MPNSSTEAVGLEDVARGVLSDEGRALALAAPAVAAAIAEAAGMIAGRDGRVIVSGVGKSGHVARKVAATLASIGKPAYFVHATEASHGDLGKLAQKNAMPAVGIADGLRRNAEMARPLHQQFADDQRARGLLPGRNRLGRRVMLHFAHDRVARDSNAVYADGRGLSRWNLRVG